jgi:hypothetical protein
MSASSALQVIIPPKMLFTTNLAMSGSRIRAGISQERHVAKRGLPGSL